MYYTESQIRKFTHYDMIVRINNRALHKHGFHKFVEQYLKYGYGYLFVPNSLELTVRNYISVILPVWFTDTSNVPYNYYVNSFLNSSCVVEPNQEFDELSDMPFDERVNMFYKRTIINL